MSKTAEPVMTVYIARIADNSIRYYMSRDDAMKAGATECYRAGMRLSDYITCNFGE